MKNTRQQAYSLIELMVIITVIGILATISTVSYSNWRKSTTETQIKNDLNMAAAAMEDARNFDDKYPKNILLHPSFKPSEGVSVTTNSSNNNFCIQAETADKKQIYSIDNSKEIKKVKCGPVFNKIDFDNIPIHNPQNVSSIPDPPYISLTQGAEYRENICDNDSSCTFKNQDYLVASNDDYTGVNNMTLCFWVGDYSNFNNRVPVASLDKFWVYFKNSTSSDEQYVYVTATIDSKYIKVPALGEGNLKFTNEQNKMIHIAVTMGYDSAANKTTITTYVDGQKSDTITTTGKYINNKESYLRFGSLLTDGSFDVKISNFSVYKYAMNSLEVAKDYMNNNPN